MQEQQALIAALQKQVNELSRKLKNQTTKSITHKNKTMNIVKNNHPEGWASQTAIGHSRMLAGG